jgi:hypothetical protein
MAKSSTRKKSNKTQLPPQVVQIADMFTDYVKYWTNNELEKLHSARDTSVCIPTADGYRIGLFRLRINKNKTCTVYDRNYEYVHTFETKVSGVLFAIYTIKQRYKLADTILALDKEINKNYMDSLALKRGIELAVKVKDYVSVDIKRARLDIAEQQLIKAKDKISSLHLTAKYNKVWQ